MTRRTASVVLATIVTGVVVLVVAVWGIQPLPSFPAMSEGAPDGVVGSVAYSSWSEGEGCAYVVAADAGATTRIACDEGGVEVAWTDTGQVLVARIGAETATGVEVTVHDPTTGEETDRYRDPDWWAGREEEVVGKGDTVRADDGAVADVVHSGGTIAVRVTVPGVPSRTVLDVDAPENYDIWAVAWSPDGRFLYTRDSEARVMVIDPTGTDRAWVLVERADRPTWYVEGKGSTVLPA